ncbi:MAG: metallopeptidase family protein [Phenylobacterium sp.]|jgi:predicted Zn-dependent protease with MMP-like domain|uniref:metallopeptidase family protein n=1 Tax=Phenylobacterium sp. TaxID=1871053 RepID=UPI0025F4ABB0|nr:metallopeptidase family protein [Phenylobacterium sp.]MCG9915481.1 metallopeptidase family protein [Phenylobacterium sp.]
MTRTVTGLAPSLDDMADLAEAAFARLPAPFRAMTGHVLFRVDDFPDQDTLDALEIEDPFDLTGLYHGVDLAHRSVMDPETHPSMVLLYRRPILDEWAARGDVTLEELVSHVLVHEIGHHFGLSDAQIEAIEAAAEADDDAPAEKLTHPSSS